MTEEITLRNKRKLETREQILRATRELVVERGYEKTTMRALAQRAGVGLGTIALHFTDKKTLLLSTFHDEIGEESLKAIRSVNRTAPLKDKLLSILGALYAYYARHSVFMRSVVKEAVFATGEWKHRFDEQLAGMLELIVGMIEDHKSLGEVAPGTDSRSVALAGWSIHLTALIDGLSSEKFDAKEQVARVEPILDALLNGVLVKK